MARKIAVKLGRTSRGGSNGACGGTPRRDGSGGGTGNRDTRRQPTRRKR